MIIHGFHVDQYVVICQAAGHSLHLQLKNYDPVKNHIHNHHYSLRSRPSHHIQELVNNHV